MCGLKTALARHLIQSAQGKAGTRWAFPLKFCPPCATEGIGLARTAHSDGGPPYAFYSAPSQGGSYPGGIPGAPAQKNTGSMRFVQRLRCGEFEKSGNCRLAVSSIGWSLVRRPDIREEEYRPRNGNGRARFYPGRPWEFHRLPCPGQKDRFRSATAETLPSNGSSRPRICRSFPWREPERGKLFRLWRRYKISRSRLQSVKYIDVHTNRNPN